MSAAAETESDAMQRCASCGITGGDAIKLKRCTACHLVRYCSVKCQKEHRAQHKKACKKRAAELKDELLFKQPESSYLGDCPICSLPLSLDPEKSAMYSCCGKIICNGCCYANVMRENEERLLHKCPFCRKAMTSEEREINERLMMRIEANDPVAISSMAKEKYHEGDYKSAFEYWTRAAALGDMMAHYQLSCLYGNGKGVEKDKNKELHHTEQAAIGGHPHARHNLGYMEAENGQVDRAAKHWIIAAKLGDDDSLKCVKDLYKDGHVSKEDFSSALRGYQTAIIAMKSPQREASEKKVAEGKRSGIL